MNTDICLKLEKQDWFSRKTRKIFAVMKEIKRKKSHIIFKIKGENVEDQSCAYKKNCYLHAFVVIKNFSLSIGFVGNKITGRQIREEEIMYRKRNRENITSTKRKL